MSYGHADKILAAAAAANTPPIDPTLYWRDDMRRTLAAHDIAALFRALKDVEVTQRTIAALTGQSQSEVSEILTGRRVLAYDLLVRIAEGLRIPRELMGLSWWGPDGTHAGSGGEITVTDPEGVAAMLRRHLIALAPIAAVAYNPVAKLAELLKNTELPGPSPVPMPSRLCGVHVAKVRDLTRRLGEACRAYGSDPEVSSAAAAWASRLLDVPGPDAVRKALMVAVAELHIEAGWDGCDAGLYDRAMHHYARALELATGAGDAYCQAFALIYAGLATVEHGQPNEGLKLLQYGGVKSRGVPLEDQRAVVIGVSGRAAVMAGACEKSATALADLDCWDAADTEMAKARELWTPTRTDSNGDLDRPAACLALKRGRLDAAEQFAAASVRRWKEGGGQVSRTLSGVVLATIHVRAGEPDGLRLAHDAVSAASKLSSVRTRRQLEPLAAALEARRSSDALQLARMARQVATTRV